MSSLEQRAVFGLAVLAALVLVPVAQACDGWGYQGFIYQRLPLRTGNVPAPPYFALHPPVYYSGLIVRRAYGDSPYAYTADRPVAAPRVFSEPAVMQPKWIENPFYREVASSTPASVGQYAESQINPFYVAADE
jgi:hypothetical protein